MYPHALVQENPPSTNSTWLSLESPTNTLSENPLNWHFLQEVQYNKGKVIYSTRTLRSPIITSPQHHSPPTSHLHPSKMSAIPQHIIPRWCSVEKHIPCVDQDIFSVQLPCYSFAIFATRPGHTTTSRWWRTKWTTSMMMAEGMGLRTNNKDTLLLPVFITIFLSIPCPITISPPGNLPTYEARPIYHLLTMSLH